MPTAQARYWMLTIPCAHNQFEPSLLDSMSYIRGQQELTADGYLHWQIMVAFSSKKTLAQVRRIIGECHAEPTRSDRAREYVWKEDTRVAGSQFEYGTLACRRNEPADWESIKRLAIEGNLEEVPPDIFVRCYSQLRRIGQDNLRPLAMERTCAVFWGRTGTGKSRRAWEEASLEAYPKDPNSKFWDGYRSHQHVVIDEFRGAISISHMLRWLDRYPCIIEVKGSSVVLCATKIWITSNLDPRQWYPNEDEETQAALLRRLEITHFQ